MVNRLAVSWVLAKKVRAAGPRGIARVVHIYWTGGNDGFGKSPFLSDAYRFLRRVEHRLHLRCEIVAEDAVDTVDRWIDLPQVGLISITAVN